MGRCMKCRHYEICSDDRVNSEEVWGQCRYFEDETVPMVPKSELARAETEIAKKIFDDIQRVLFPAFDDFLDEIHFMIDERVWDKLKKKYKVED